MTPRGDPPRQAARPDARATPPAAAPFRSGFVALLGRPNVGKSSLCNRLAGERVAIVSDKPQTTRRRIAAVLHPPGGQIVLLDTPGVHRARDGLGQRMVRAARDALDGADAAALAVDCSVPTPTQNDRRAAHTVLAAPCPRLLLLNKADLVEAPDRAERAEAYTRLAAAGRPWDRVLFVSAVSGEGLPALVTAMLALMPTGPAYFPEDALTDQPEQFLVAELVREQALARLRDEVPHALAVTIEDWRVRDSGTVYIAATLHVERESQKGIVIGRGGRMLRDIGQGARKEAERRLDAQVYLALRVKVRPGWRDRPGSLESLGMGSRD